MTASTAPAAAEIAAAIAAADGNVTAAAAALGMSRSTLRRRIAASQPAAVEAPEVKVAALVVEAQDDAAPAGPAASKVMQRMSPAAVALKAPYAVTRTMLANGYAGAAIAAPESDAATAAPAGLVSPIRFYAILQDRNLAAAGLTEGNVRNWFRKIVMGFPALNVTDDGIVHQAPVDVDGKRVSRPVVDLEAGIAWYAAYTSRAATRAANRQAA